MSLKLTNRLDKLENEIRVMLMLQKCGCQQLQGANVTTTGDGNIKGIGVDANEQQLKTQATSKQRQFTQPLKCTHECAKRSPKSSVTGDYDSSWRSTKHPSQGCCCIPAYKTVCYKPESILPKPSLTSPQEKICKCGKSPIKELELERERRMRAEEEIQKLKFQFANVSQSKCMALNMTKQLKQRYERMKGAHEETASKLALVTREKDFLCRCLEKERQENVMKSKGDTGVQVLNKELDKRAITTIKQQSAKIKSLNNSVLSLSKIVEDKDFEKKKLEHEKDKIHEKLKKHKDITKKLSETNAKLAKSVRQKHDSFMALRNKAGKYQKELLEQKNETRRSQLELEKIKAEFEKYKSRDDSLLSATEKDVDAMEDKLKRTKEKERRASETIQFLSQKIRDLESKDPKSLERELQRKDKDLKILEVKYNETLNKLKSLEEADSERSENIKSEMKSFADDLVAKETALIEEKENMKQLIDELQGIIDQQKTRLDELEGLKQQQDIVIKSQNEQLSSKEEQIKLREREIDLIKQQTLDIHKQMDELKLSVDQYDQMSTTSTNNELKEKIRRLSGEVDELKATLDDEKQKTILKDKVIENQFNTIQELKKQLSEKENDIEKLFSKTKEATIRVKTSQEKLSRVTRQLAKEQEVSRKTVSNLMSMEKKKKKLERDVEDLEEAYDEFSSISFLTKLDEQQKQWNEEKKKITEERDRAIGAAKLATKTLMETLDDFQGEVKSQQKLQKIVTDIIISKSQQNLPPCMRRRELDRARNMQLAIPCRPVMPQYNLRAHFPTSEEEGFFTASSGKDSGHSDTNDSALEGQKRIFGLFGQYNKNLSTFTRPSTGTSPKRECRCFNTNSPKKSTRFPISDDSSKKSCQCCNSKSR